MTLKEKFNDLVPKEFGGMQESLLSNCEKIADEFAVSFADWLDLDETQDLIQSLQMVGELSKIPKTKELLEIFKKEKGL